MEDYRKPYILHLFNPDHNYGGCTIAWDFCLAPQKGKMVEFTVVYCSRKDMYIRNKGYRLAMHEFEEGHTILAPLNSGGMGIAEVQSKLGMMFDGTW